MASDQIPSASGLAYFANTIYQIYKHSRRKEFLDLAIKTADRALDQPAKTAKKDQHYAARLSDAAKYLNLLYHQYGGDEATQQRLIQLSRDSAHATSRDDPDLAARFSRLSHVLERQFMLQKRKFGDLVEVGDLVEAIEAAKKAKAATPVHNVHEAARLDDLARLESLFDFSGGKEDRLSHLRNAIEYGRQALEAKDDNERNYAARLGYLSTLSMRLWAHDCKDNALLDEAIEYAERAEKKTKDKDPDKPMRMRNLSVRLLKRYELARGRNAQEIEQDIERALMFAEKSNSSTQRDSKKASRLSNLARIHQSRYEHTGEEKDLNEGIKYARDAQNAYEEALKDIKYAREALQNASENLEDAAWKLAQNYYNLSWELAQTYNNLSTLYLLWFRRTSGSADIESAVSYARNAWNAVEKLSSASSDAGGVVSNLAMMLETKFKRLGDIDRQDAVSRAWDAVEKLNSASSDAGGVVSNLAMMLETKFKRLGDDTDLQDAVSFAEEAVQRTGESNKALQAARLSDLASVLETRFKHTRKSNDIRKAVSHAQKAVALTGDDDPNRPRRINVLASAIVTLSRSDYKPSDLSRSLKDIIEEMNATANNVHGPNRAGMLFNLGRVLEIQNDRPGARTAYEKTAECEMAPPLLRIRAWRKAGILHADDGKWPCAFEMFQKAISMLPRVSLRWLSLDDHEHILGQLSGLSSLVATAALEAGKDQLEALVWAEKGRGVIARLATDAPSNLSGLPGKGEIAERFDELRNMVNSGPSSREAWPKVASSVSEKTNRRLLEVEKDIGKATRDITEWLSADRLRKLAQRGPIVSFNSTRYGSGAFLITEDKNNPVRFKKLDCLEFQRAEEYAEILRKMEIKKLENLVENNKQLRKILRWLWEKAVKPILDELGMTGTTNNQLPRIWWVASGVLGSFPLHAAGSDHKPGSKQNALSRAVSTYVPTVRSLQYSRSKAPHSRIASSKHVLAITAPSVAGRRKLNHVENELLAIGEALRDLPCKEVVKKEYPSSLASSHEALEILRGTTLVHFACHGEYKKDNPSKSGLLLGDKEDGGYERLTAGELIGMRTRGRLRNPGLAYLSACSMAKNGTRALVDEAIHPANALFRAGFPNVVAPLWEVRDPVAPDLAGKFYLQLAEFIRANDKNKRWDRAVADALHKATVLRLKKGNGRNQPIDWATFVHIGC